MDIVEFAEQLGFKLAKWQKMYLKIYEKLPEQIIMPRHYGEKLIRWQIAENLINLLSTNDLVLPEK